MKDIKQIMKDGGPERDQLILQQENNVRIIINRMWPTLFPHIPFSPLKLASNKSSSLDTRNEHFFIEIKSTTQSVDIYGYPLDSEKLKKMMSQAYTAYMEDKRRRDVFLVVQHLKSEKHFKLYLFNLTRDFDLSSHSNPFNHSENKWPWNGKEKIYVNKLSSEKLNKQVYKLMPSQAQIIYDNTYEMEQKI